MDRAAWAWMPTTDGPNWIAGNATRMAKINRRQAIQAGLGAASAAATSSSEAATIGNSGCSLPVIVERTRSSASDYKRQAMADYAANMKPFGGSLSRHGRCLMQHEATAQSQTSHGCDFDVIIIGSGYGASICAARLSIAKRPGVRIGILERGREWVPGTFADTLGDASGESRFQMLGRKKGEIKNPVGLVNVMRNDEVNVVSGSGLGGSSLINASVAIRPDADCFAQSEWPSALRDRNVLDPYFDRAAWELGVVRETADASPKARSQRLAAARLAGCGAKLEPAKITVTRAVAPGQPRPAGPILNRQGMIQRGCIDCGDCNSGCNVGAKNTLTSNYLPVARRFGTEMYTHTEVVRVEKIGSIYRIYFKTYSQGHDGQYTTQYGSVTSRLVILGAGSIGSNEILLRSRGCGMHLSEQVGQRWTMNGDALGFVRKSQHLTNIAAFGAYPHEGPPVGPTIQTNLTYPGRADLSKRVLIQDGSVSRGYANILGLLMRDMDFDRTLVMLGMGHDGSQGRVVIGADGLGSVKWPGLKESPYRKLIRGEFAKVASAHGGKYKYLKIFGDNYITVHPLGGCAMADDPIHGVVDDLGRVFDPVGNPHHSGMRGHDGARTQGPSIHQGLYVADGAVIPRSIGCNPLMTISALAERIAEGICHDPAHQDLFAVS